MPAPRSILTLTLLVPLLVVVGAVGEPAMSGQVSAPVAAGPAAPVEQAVDPRVIRRPSVAPRRSSSVTLAVANLREGSLLRHAADQRDGHDRRAFARRLLTRPGRAPDVVLVQEVLGSADAVAAALTTALRRRDRPGRYAVVTATDHRFESGTCDGVRTGRFSVLRSSAILVNVATVSDVLARGTVRTWGRWSPVVSPITGQSGHGCTEHPWVRLTVRTPAGPRTATLLNAHVAPSGTDLKGRAVAALTRQLRLLTDRVPTDVTALAGDLNLARCGAVDDVQRTGCVVRPAHRALRDQGLRDAVRERHPTGPAGVVGVTRRIDFVYTPDTVTAAWWDRCHHAFRVTRWSCAGRGVFASETRFVACQTRALYYGTAGDGCSRADFGRYYSDHPIVTTSLR